MRGRQGKGISRRRFPIDTNISGSRGEAQDPGADFLESFPSADPSITSPPWAGGAIGSSAGSLTSKKNLRAVAHLCRFGYVRHEAQVTEQREKEQVAGNKVGTPSRTSRSTTAPPHGTGHPSPRGYSPCCQRTDMSRPRAADRTVNVRLPRTQSRDRHSPAKPMGPDGLSDGTGLGRVFE